ncbi:MULTISPECIES: SAM hydroxide adenosyltransferase [unclassified Streptomyces]|uniref:SAM hydroxide adenosyltransferase n=1 Tax=unclassified Streptomyces TaxID=2593676 RepID=UPI00226FE756|nr:MULTISPECIES: SAM hydroxide adenosyltransferase [unclassified Streptomyces]MCY0920623.1 SAM-dependent chlorinase/fluorinase [Streptomyces sp. H27-G5]MCY0962627.1 SAM-dependent chlorinase/fluorinase [Streptomyces sp. H27-H5]
MSHLPVVALTDCADPNALARQSARIATLFGGTPTVLPLGGPDPEGAAALTLLDLLRSTDLTGGPTRPVVVMVNIAPRDGHWPNGVPFCYFRHGQHLVISTVNHRVLAPLVTYLGLEEVQVTDVREVLEAAAAGWAELADTEVEEIVRTQFRSLWYVPLLARWLADGRPVPAQPLAVRPPAEEAVRVAVVDNFGNCKLDRPAVELPGYDGTDGLTVHSRRDGRGVRVRCYDRLPDVPLGEPGITVGSSGIGFAELVVRGGSAAELFGLTQGDQVFRLAG